jgi:uncharacterized protein YfaP (DUF2135 family)
MAGAKYEMVMPFVACASHGGAYDDDSFVAGWRMADLDAALRAADASRPMAATIRPAEQTQADLIAMRHGWRVSTAEDAVPGEWLTVHFARAEEAPS